MTYDKSNAKKIRKKNKDGEEISEYEDEVEPEEDQKKANKLDESEVIYCPSEMK